MLVGLHSVSGPKWCQLRMLKLLYIIIELKLHYIINDTYHLHTLQYHWATGMLCLKKAFFKGQVGLWLGLDSEAAKTICLHTLISFPPPQISLSTWLCPSPLLWPPLICASWCPLFMCIQDGSPTGLTGERNTIIGFKQATGIHWFLFFPSCLVSFFHHTERDSMLRSPISIM